MATSQLERAPDADWIGLGLPIVRYNGGYFKPKKNTDLIWSSILLILGTPIGTRPMVPEFGSRFVDMIFEPNDSVLVRTAQREVVSAISRWEPRVEIQEASVIPDENVLALTIRFTLVSDPGRPPEGRQFLIARDSAFRVVDQVVF